MDRHFPLNSMTPEVLFIKSPRDLRTPDGPCRPRADGPAGQPTARHHDGAGLDPAQRGTAGADQGCRIRPAKSAANSTKHPPRSTTTAATWTSWPTVPTQLADALAQVRGQVNGAVGSLSAMVRALLGYGAALGGDKTIKPARPGRQARRAHAGARRRAQREHRPMSRTPPPGPTRC